VAYDAAGGAVFRSAQGLSEKFVVMYSGNHSPCHSLDTLLGAARKLVDREDIAFCFVGGGSEYEKVKIQAHQLRNIVCLPYQPLDRLAMSLSAADVHVVVMGDSFTGIVHPCKIYNILEIGSPVLYIGPPTSHVVDVIAQLDDLDLVCSARHGDVDAVTNYILAGAKSIAGRRSPAAIKRAAAFSKEAVLPKIVELIELVPAPKFENSAVVADTKAQWLS
jgi:glycosyltransferase involved in cell wall biosynthesis